MCCFVIVATALVASLGNAGFSQQSLLKTEDSRNEFQLGAYHSDATGNQDWVREYDGRDLNLLGIESLSTYGYKNDMQYWLDAHDLIVGDEDILFGFATGNVFKLRGSTNKLTHRLAATPSINPYVARELSTIVPAPAALILGTNRDTFIDLSPGAKYSMDRRVNTLSLYGNPGSYQRVGLAADWWQQAESGQRQLLFRARAAQPGGPMTSGKRGGIALPVDRETNESSIGTDVAIGNSSVVNYRFNNVKFEDNRSSFASIPADNFLPLNNLTKIGSETQSHVLKARSNITDKLQFTGVYINKERTNSSNAIPTGYANAGSALNKKVRINSVNMALAYRANDSLSITGRWRQLDQDNLVPPVFAVSNGVTSATPGNLALSRDERSFELEGVFTGIPRAYLRFGFENRNMNRENSSLHSGQDTFELPFTSPSTNWDIWRAALRYHPFMRLDISANYENKSANNSGYSGAANNATKTNVNATYMVLDNFALYGDLSRSNESNNQVRVAGVIPNQAANAAEQELREEAAGQGYNSKFTTGTIGTWFSVNDRLTLDANYGNVSMDSGALWIIGTEAAYVPHLAPDFVPFKSSSQQWSAGANYATKHKMRFYGRFLHANSSGSNLIDPTIFKGLGPNWTPFKVRDNRWTLGMGYVMSLKDTMSVDYSLGQWVDEIDSGQTGQYSLWRMSWTRQF